MTPDSYHSDFSRVSRSMLNDFRICPTLYHGLYVAQTIPQDEPSLEMRVGTLTHSLLQHDGLLVDIAVPSEKWDGRTKAGKEAKAAFAAESVGKIIADPDEFEIARKMFDAVMASPLASQIVNAAIERETVKHFSAFGLDCRCKPDLLGNSCIADLKTTLDPQPDAFARSAVSWGYHRQAAFYLDGCQRESFWFIAVRRGQPFDVVVYRVSDDLVRLGREENAKLLTELKDCYDFDVWEPRYLDAQILDLPRWMKRERELYRGLSNVSFSDHATST